VQSQTFFLKAENLQLFLIYLTNSPCHLLIYFSMYLDQKTAKWPFWSSS